MLNKSNMKSAAKTYIMLWQQWPEQSR